MSYVRVCWLMCILWKLKWIYAMGDNVCHCTARMVSTIGTKCCVSQVWFDSNSNSVQIMFVISSGQLMLVEYWVFALVARLSAALRLFTLWYFDCGKTGAIDERRDVMPSGSIHTYIHICNVPIINIAHTPYVTANEISFDLFGRTYA